MIIISFLRVTHCKKIITEMQGNEQKKSYERLKRMNNWIQIWDVTA